MDTPAKRIMVNGHRYVLAEEVEMLPGFDKPPYVRFQPRRPGRSRKDLTKRKIMPRPAQLLFYPSKGRPVPLSVDVARYIITNAAEIKAKVEEARNNPELLNTRQPSLSLPVGKNYPLTLYPDGWDELLGTVTQMKDILSRQGYPFA